MSGSTKKELVEDLLKKPVTEARSILIRDARDGYYHDFDSALATPKIALEADLRRAGYDDLAAKVRDGAYDDEEPSPEQLEELRRHVGPRVFDAVMGEKKRRARS